MWRSSYVLTVSIKTVEHLCSHVVSVMSASKKSDNSEVQIQNLKNLIPTEAKLQFYINFIYKAAILPHLTYCHLTWHFCKASDRRKLERIQERGLRAVFKDKHSCYEKLLAKADIPSLYNRRLQDIAIFMYKVRHNFCHRDFAIVSY